MTQREEFKASRGRDALENADTEAASLRAQLEDLKRALADERAKSQSLKAKAQLLKDLLKEQRLRSDSGREPVSTAAPSGQRLAAMCKALLFAAHFLSAQELLELGSASAACHRLAQEDSLWHAICLRHFRLSKARHCTNFRAKILCSVARRAKQKFQASAETERAKGMMYRKQAESERARVQRAVQELNTFVVVWTVSEEQLSATGPGHCLQSEDFVARGQHGYFTFYPKGGGGHLRSAFYICFMKNRRLTISADVYLGERQCMHIRHTWGRKARPGQGVGWSNAGPPFEPADAPLTIWVEFMKLYQDGSGDYFRYI